MISNFKKQSKYLSLLTKEQREELRNKIKELNEITGSNFFSLDNFVYLRNGDSYFVLKVSEKGKKPFLLRLTCNDKNYNLKRMNNFLEKPTDENILYKAFKEIEYQASFGSEVFQNKHSFERKENDFKFHDIIKLGWIKDIKSDIIFNQTEVDISEKNFNIKEIFRSYFTNLEKFEKHQDQVKNHYSKIFEVFKNTESDSYKNLRKILKEE